MRDDSISPVTYSLVTGDVTLGYGGGHVAGDCLEITASGIDLASGWVRPTQSTHTSEDESA